MSLTVVSPSTRHCFWNKAKDLGALKDLLKDESTLVSDYNYGRKDVKNQRV